MSPAPLILVLQLIRLFNKHRHQYTDGFRYQQKSGGNYTDEYRMEHMHPRIPKEHMFTTTERLQAPQLHSDWPLEYEN